MLVEHLWAAGLRETVRKAGGRLLGQGFLTPEVVMVVGSELRARADAQAALELAEATRASALVDALAAIASRGDAAAGGARARRRARSSACSSSQGFVHADRGRGRGRRRSPPRACSRSALVEAAVAEAEDAPRDD